MAIDTKPFVMSMTLFCGLGLGVIGFLDNEIHNIIIGVIYIIGACFIETEVE